MSSTYTSCPILWLVPQGSFSYIHSVHLSPATVNFCDRGQELGCRVAAHKEATVQQEVNTEPWHKSMD